MWRENKVWMHYVKNIIAADVTSAVFLASYIRYITLNRDFVRALEVIDLQRYKIIRKPGKVYNTIRERSKIPFVFVISRN